METKITVTPEEVAENMKDVLVRTVVEFGKPCTYVTVRMKNGFTLRESTTCVDPANYNEEIGKQVCLKRIEDKVWFLLGYALQDKAYKEQVARSVVKLQEKWSDGDILIRKDNNDIFCVYQEPVDNGKGFLCHVYVSKDVCFTGVTVPTDPAGNYRKATDAEKSTFYSLINNDHHLWWDAVNKVLVGLGSHPNYGQKYYAVSASGSVVDATWYDSSVDKALLRAGNWFLTKEEAEAAAERVRKALKGE